MNSEIIRIFKDVSDRRKNSSDALKEIEQIYKERQQENESARFRKVFHYDDILLRDHQIYGNRFLMGVVHCSLGIDAAAKRFPDLKIYQLSKIFFSRAVKVDSGDEVRLDIRCFQKGGQAYFESAYEDRDGERIVSASGEIGFSPRDVNHPSPESIGLAIEEGRKVGAEIFYKNQAIYGGSLHTLRDIHFHRENVVGSFSLTPEIANEKTQYFIHPALFDAAHINALFAADLDFVGNQPWVPLFVDRIYIHETPGKEGYCLTTMVRKTSELLVTNNYYYSPDYEFLMCIEGFRIKKVSSIQSLENTGDNHPAPPAAAAAVSGPAVAQARDRCGSRPRISGEMVEKYITRKIEALEGAGLKRSAKGISTQKNFMDIGLDSQHLISLIPLIEKDLGVELYPTLFFEYQNIHELSQYFLEQHRSALDACFGPGLAGTGEGVEETVPASRTERAPGAAGANDGEERILAPCPALPDSGEKRNGSRDDIAIIGMAGRICGESDLEKFWDKLKSGKDLIEEIPPERWDYRPWFSENMDAENRIYSKWGSFIGDVDRFDARFFEINPNEAVWLDPQLRILLEVVHDTLEDAGYTARISGTKTGVYVGVCFQEYWDEIVRHNVPITSYEYSSSIMSTISGRISYYFDLQGPSIPLDNSCASSLTALDLAVKAIRANEIDMAFVAGTNLLLSPLHYVYFSAIKALSPDGRCFSFDDRANGYVPGEGCLSVLLKPLQKAREDNDNIHAVIKGVAVNHVGRSNNPTSPRAALQTKVLLNAWENARIHPDVLSYIEAHGTGTRLGDPVEITAMHNAFSKKEKRSKCMVGSLKAHVGHLEAAAGIAGVIKTVLSIKHKQIPAIPNLKTLNPYINLDNSPLVFNRELAPWVSEDGGPRTAGVSSFGMSGNNAHVVIQEYVPGDSDGEDTVISPFIIPLSAKSRGALDKVCFRLKAFLERTYREAWRPADLRDIAHTLQMGRKAMSRRVSIVTADMNDLITRLSFFCEGKFPIAHLYGNDPDQKHIDPDTSGGDPGRARISEMVRQKDFDTLARLWCSGVQIPWELLYTDSRPRYVSLPPYPYDRKRYWKPSPGSIPNALKNRTDPNPYPHPLVHTNRSSFQHCRFESIFTGNEFFFEDHVVNRQKILPGAAYLEMARAAGEIAGERTVAGLMNLIWSHPISVTDVSGSTVLTALSRRKGKNRFEICCGEPSEDGGRVCASGVIVYEGQAGHDKPGGFSAINIDEVKRQATDSMDKAKFYDIAGSRGFCYGKGFRAVEKIWFNGIQAVSRLIVPEEVRHHCETMPLHPALLDGAVQTVMGLQYHDRNREKGYAVPFCMDSLDLVRPPADECFAYAVHGGKENTYDIFLTDKKGEVLVRLKNLIFMNLKGKQAGEDENAGRISCFRQAWEPSPIPGSTGLQPETGGTNLLVFDHDTRLCDSLNNDAENGPVRAILVRPGSAFREDGDNGFEIDPGNIPDYEKLIQALVRREQAPGIIIYRWPDSPGDPPGDRLDRNLELGIYPVFHLCQALVKQDSRFQATFLYVFHEKKDGFDPVHAAVPGFGKVLHNEHPGLNFKTICFTRETAAGGPNLAKTLLSELGNSHPEVRYRGSERYILETRDIDWKGATDTLDGQESGELLLKDNGIYLITGGLGKLGLIFAEHLAKKVGATLVLTGRKPLDARGESEISKIESYGSRVSYVRADVSNRQDVISLLETCKKSYGAVDGIIHGAGLIKDSLFKNKSFADFKQVIRPKVHGTCYLAESARDMDPDFLVLFSSISAFYGNMGQADYAYANSFMDQFALQRGKTISINWPLWKDGGMGVNKEIEDWILKKYNLKPLATGKGLEIFHSALRLNFPQVLVMANREAPAQEPDAADGDGFVQSRNRADTGRKAKHGSGRDVGTSLEIERDILSICAEALNVAPEDLDAEEDIGSYGMDSIVMTKILNDLESLYNCAINPSSLVEIPTIRDFTGYLVASGVVRTTPDRQRPANPSPSILLGKGRPHAGMESPERPSRARTKKIAVIGMACRFPRSFSLETYWDNLAAGRNLIVEVPENRWGVADYFSTDKSDMRKSYSKWGGFIDNLDLFDEEFFGISPADALVMDPQQRIMMELTQELFDRAGYRRDEVENTNTAVWIGGCDSSYVKNNLGKISDSSRNRLVVNSIQNMMAARISNHYNLKGASQTVDTACSSSLIAIHNAARALRDNEADMALAGGIGLLIDPYAHIWFSNADVLSDSGRSYVFDERANGFVLGEGAGLVLLKRYDRALEDGDNILGVIMGSAVNNDGRTVGVTIPDKQSQKEVIRKAIDDAGVSAENISYLEAHGTGTLIGDPIEIHAATEAFREDTRKCGYCAVGSVKSNIGHLLHGAGVASFIKVILSLNHRKIPATLNCEKPHKRFQFDQSPFYPNVETRVWEPENGSRCAGISSFGFGGTNCHMIVEAFTGRERNPSVSVRSPLPLTPLKRKHFWIGYEVREYDGRGTAGAGPVLAGGNGREDLGDLETAIGKYIAGKLALLLSVPESSVGADENLIDMGADSNNLVRLVGEFEKEVGIELYPTIFFQYQNIKSLAGHFAATYGPRFSQYLGRTSPRPPAQSFSDRPTPDGALSRDGNGRGKRVCFPGPGPENSPGNRTSQSVREDIAIIGMAGMTGGAGTLEEFWKNLVNHKNPIQAIPEQRFDYRPYFDTTRQNGKTYCKWGGFIEGHDLFDAGFFQVSGKEAEMMDPQLRLLLHVLYQAAEDAGAINSIRHTNTGMYVGCCFQDYHDRMNALQLQSPYKGTGNALTMISNRPSYYFDLFGPSVTIDTACSSSAAALHAACTALRNSECDMAFAAGVNLILAPEHYTYFSAIGALSPSGRCRSFEARADGYVPGEAIGAVLLKPLSRAQKNGDRIHAVIKGTALSHGGKAPAVTAPDSARQAYVISKAWRDAGIDPESIGYIEAHGTGTRLGDPLEIEGLHNAFRQHTSAAGFCAVGSVKAHIGHTEGAAGIIGVIKTVLMMQNGLITAMPDFRTLNPYIDLDGGALYINPKHQKWDPPKGLPRRAGVSCFGFGGTYAHIVVEEYDGQAPHIHQRENRPGLFLASAQNETVLSEYLEHILNYIEEHLLDSDDPLLFASFLHAMRFCREHMTERIAVIASNPKALLKKLKQYSRGKLTRSDLCASGDNGPLEKTARAWLKGEEIPLPAQYGPGMFRKIPLPAYPICRERYWFQPDPPLEDRDEKKTETVPLKIGRSAGKMTLKDKNSRDATLDLRDKSIPGDDMEPYLMDRINEILSGLLNVDGDMIDSDSPLVDLGLDSIGAVELINALNKMFRTPLKATLLYDFPTVRNLAGHLAKLSDNLNADIRTMPGTGPRAPKTETGPATAGLPREAPVGRQKAVPRKEKKIVLENKGGPARETALGENLRGVAVIGMSGRFPGAEDVDEYWEKLKNGIDCVTRVPQDRWKVEAFYDPDPGKPNRTYCKWGGFIDGVDKFDARFFKIPPAEAEVMDPHQRLLLEECIGALNNANYSEETLNGLNCGVYIGVVNNSEYSGLMKNRNRYPNLGHLMLGNANSILSARIAYHLNLTGPAVSIDTACSSSLVAIDLACDKLMKGDIRMALAGGVLLCLGNQRYLMTSKIGALSPTGKCRTFDAGADGYVPGEGVGVVVLKRLEHAVEDGDHIYGVIIGSGTNQDGSTNGITAPSSESQKRLVLDVYEKYGIQPESITYVEAHGTGTKLGDPIEVTALSEAFGGYTSRKQFCAIGSVKTNIGHLSAAAGVASVIKALLCLKHGQIPPSLNFKQENPHIRFSDTPFYVNTELKKWDIGAGAPRRVAVSSFGLSGTNCHMVLEAYRPPQKPEPSWTPPFFLVPFSAKTPEALNRTIRRFLSKISRSGAGIRLGDISYSLLTGRTRYRECAVFMAGDINELNARLAEYLATGTAKEGFASSSGQAGANGRKSLDDYGNYLITELSKAQSSAPEAYREKLASLAELYAAGRRLEWQRLFPAGVFSRVPLVNYCFQRERYWIPVEEEPSGEIGDKGVKVGPGFRFREIEDSKFATRIPKDGFYLTDHVINGQKVFPAVACLEMARAAAQALEPDKNIWKLKNLIWAQPLVVEGDDADVFITFHRTGEEAEFKIGTAGGPNGETVHSQGTAVYRPEGSDGGDGGAIEIDSILSRCPRSIAKKELYKTFERLGVNYGPGFQSIDRINYNGSESMARIRFRPDGTRDTDGFILHPAVMDGALQTVIGLAKQLNPADSVYLPFVLSEVEIFRSPGTNCHAYATHAGKISGESGRVMKFNILLTDENGKVLIRIKDFSLRAAAPSKEKEHARGSGSDAPVFLFSPVWRTAQIPPTPKENPPSRTLLVFSRRQDSAEAFREKFQKVVTVFPGTEFKESGRFSYEINPARQGDFERLFLGLDGRGLFPETMVHDWSRDLAAGFGEDFGDYLAHSITALFHMFKALGNYRKNRFRFIYVFFSETQRPQPQYAAVHAFLRTVRLENSAWDMQSVDIRKTVTEPELADTIAREIHTDQWIDSQVRYDAAGRWVCSVGDIPGETADAPRFREKGVYMITGGAGGLGLIFARYLAAGFGARLILVGRSTPSPEKQAAINDINTGGGEAVYVRADISDQADVHRLLTRAKDLFCRVDGIIHAAGVTRDSYFFNKSQRDLQAVLAPKVYGTLHLFNAFKDEPLDFFVFFSAIAAVSGNPGQSDYAYANSFMDHFAHMWNTAGPRNSRQCRILSVNWSLWKEGGMTIDDQTENLLGKLGISPIKTEDGLGALVRGLALNEVQVVAAAGDCNKIRELLLPDSREEDRPPETPGHAAGPLPENKGRVGDFITESLIRGVVKTLKIPPRTIDLDIDLADYGFDSISLTAFANVLNEALDLNLTPAIFFELDLPNIRTLAAYLEKEYGADVAAGCQRKTAPVLSDEPPVSVRALPGDKKDSRDGPVAVIGISGVMPRSKSLSEFWRHLCAGKDLISEVPEDRWDWESFHGDPQEDALKTDARWGGFMPDVDKFDAEFFNISNREAQLMDPQQRIFMETAWKTIEDAGYNPKTLSGKKVGVFVGVATADYYELINARRETLDVYETTGMAHSILANRISFLLNLHGPSEPVNTACSSSLLAVKKGIDAIRTKDCEMALAGGVNVILSPMLQISFSKAGMLSKKGRCFTFDERADGYVRGEGAGAVLLKSLARAQKDGDHIYGVILGSATNHGGHASSLTAPNAKAQASLLADAYEDAGIDPGTVSYIETHGTGTKIGDPVEINGLKSAFGDASRHESGGMLSRCGLGSVKTNIGHLETAAGIAGLIKVLLAMKHETIPGNLHFNTLNSFISLAGTPFYIVDKTMPWNRHWDDQNRPVPRRAGVSSFGFGGSNVHLVVEEYPRDEKTEPGLTAPGPRLFVLSANGRSALENYAVAMKSHIEAEKDLPMSDMAYTLQTGREAFSDRLAIIASGADELVEGLDRFIKRIPAADGIFTGRVLDGADVRHAPVAGGDIDPPNSLEKLGRLWVAGADMDWSVLHSPGLKRIPLPTYPFARKRFWVTPEARVPADSKEAGDETSQVLYYHPHWEEVNTGDSGAERETPRRFLVFDFSGGDCTDALEIAPGLQAPAQVNRHSVVLVRPGAVYGSGRSPHFCVNPGSPEDYRRLAARLKQEDTFPDTVIFLDTGENGNHGKKPIYETDGHMNRGVYAVFNFIRACTQLGETAGPDRIYYIHGENRNDPGIFREAAAGYIKSLPLAFPALSFSTIKLAGPVRDMGQADWKTVRGLIWGIATNDSGEFRVEKGRVYRKTVKKAGDLPFEKLRLIKRGVYLITGGLGALGTMVARHLAESYQANLILTGRSPISGNMQQTLERLKAAGGNIQYLRADAADLDGMMRIVDRIRKEFGPLNGVIHGAGVANTQVIREKDLDSFKETVQPKIAGTIVLDQVTKDHPLDFFVMFSSISSILGDFGQCDYAVGNRFLDGYARYREQLRRENRRNGRTVSINWPLWKEGAMHLEGEAETLYAKSTGMYPMETGKGLDAFDKILSGRGCQVMVFSGDGERIERILSRKPGALTDIEKIRRDIKRIISGVLKMSHHRIGDTVNIGGLGFDSLALKEFAYILGKTYKCDISPTLFFHKSTVHEISRYLMDKRGDRIRAAAVRADNPAGTVSASGAARVSVIPDSLERRDETAVAIIGMSGRFAGADDLEQFWRALEAGENLVSEVPGTRWGRDEWPDDTWIENRDKPYLKSGGFLRNVDQFDAGFFKISPAEAEVIDPQQRMFLETVWHTIEDAGYKASDLSGRPIGVFAGVQFNDYQQLLAREDAPYTAHMATGNSHAILANRVSYFFNFNGPSESIDTACSSSLVAVNRAVGAIRGQECEMAVAGGVSLILDPRNIIATDRLGVLSRQGKCRTFDKSADGYVKGEGMGAILLKPLHKAVRDRDNIHAVIKGSHVNHGGRANSLTAPNSRAQCDLIAKAYRKSNMDLRGVSYIETHGTGTELGDPVEVESILDALGEFENPKTDGSNAVYTCGLGSVKTNIGHLEAAAGIAGILKVVLSLKNRTLPGTLHFKEINPYIKIEGTPLYIVENTIKWDTPKNNGEGGGPRTAGVNSFGFGGANAHVILQEYARETPANGSVGKTPYIIVLSAKSPEALTAYATKIADYLESTGRPDTPPFQMADFAYTLQTGREEMACRLAVLVNDAEELAGKLRRFVRGETGMAHLHTNGGDGKPATEAHSDRDKDRMRQWARDEAYENIAGAWVNGAPMNWEWLHEGNAQKPYRMPLPTYPFDRKRFWFSRSGLSRPSAWDIFKKVEAGQMSADEAGALMETLQ